MAKKTILVTGGAGYVGSHFLKFASKEDKYNFVILDDFRTGHKEALSQFKDIAIEQSDIGDTDRLARIFQTYKVCTVLHFAASCYVGESQTNLGKYWHNNVANSIALFYAMENAQVNKIIFSSSCAVYGIPDSKEITENTALKPANVYGLTKKIVEDILRSYCERLGWSAICLRYFNAAGADPEGQIGESHDPETHAIPLVLQAAAGKRPHFEIFGNDYPTVDGTCIRDYIHVMDLGQAHCLAMKAIEDIKGFKAFNLGTEFGTSVQELIDKARTITGSNFEVKVSARRTGDPPMLVAAAHEAARTLGWQPQYDMDAIIKTAWNWEQNRRF